MSASESALHLHLKRLSLIWAQANQYPVAACEVSLPNLRFRIDVGAYRPGSKRVAPAAAAAQAGGKPRRAVKVGALGTVAVFEAKASRADFLRDSRRTERLSERIRELSEKRVLLEGFLKRHFPCLSRGDGLWPEYETYSFEDADYAPYKKVLREMRMLSGQLHAQTKLDDLQRWKAANFHYLVVEPGVLSQAEVPSGWGLLVREADRLELKVLPELCEITEEARLHFLHRLAIAGTKASNREQGIAYEAIDCERRGLSGQRGA